MQYLMLLESLYVPPQTWTRPVHELVKKLTISWTGQRGWPVHELVNFRLKIDRVHESGQQLLLRYAVWGKRVYSLYENNKTKAD